MTATVPLLVMSLMAAPERVVVFVDGARMDIQTYEVRGPLVMLKTRDGKLRSVSRAYVDLEATERLNRSIAPPDVMRTESIEPERVVPEPVVSPSAPPSRSSASPPKRTLSPAPPVWSNEELQVSLVVPSSDWLLAVHPTSELAVAFEHEQNEAQATMTVIRRKIRGRKDFQKVVDEVRASVSRSSGYRPILDDATTIGPYRTHEYRFTTTVAAAEIYHRLIVVYSRDLAYLLSLSCPSVRLESNEADFDAFVRGLVIKKSSRETSF